MTEVDINQMIEDAIDSYVPTIKTLGQFGDITFVSGQATINISSSASIFIMFCSARTFLSTINDSIDMAHVLAIVKTGTTWSSVTVRNSSSGPLSLSGSGNTINISYPSTAYTMHYGSYLYF